METHKIRFHTLDALRGLAAITVMLNHLTLPFASSSYPVIARVLDSLRDTPLHFLFSGHEAVLLFFLLSGFVLHHSLRDKSLRQSYLPFLIKRLFRLWVPYIIAIGVGVIAFEALRPDGINSLSDTFNQIWSGHVTFVTLVEFFIMIGPIQYNLIDPVIWSLVVEMRISIIFPLFSRMMGRFRTATLLVLSSAWLLLFGELAEKISGIFVTGEYTALFWVGIILSMRHRDIVAFLSQRLVAYRFCCILAMLCYTAPYWIFYQYYSKVGFNTIDDFVSSVGASLLICAALLNKGTLGVLLSSPISQFLGKISYSLYLYHFIVILSVAYIGSRYCPYTVLAIISAVLSILLSTVAYMFVERPSMEIGRRLSLVVENRCSQSVEYHAIESEQLISE